MSPLDRRRRRRILGARARVRLIPSLIVAVVALLLIGGALKVGSQSASYQRAIDHSYAIQAGAIASQGTHVDAELSSLLGTVKTRTRPELEATLDTLVRSSGDLARAAATSASPAPGGGAGPELANAFAERSQAMTGLRTAVDRLLGMSPLPVPGSPVPTSPAVTTVGDTPLSAPSAVAALDRVGALLDESDRAYAAARRSLRTALGHAELPASVWANRRSGWGSGSPVSLVGALTTAPQLAVVHRVALLVDDVGLTPPAVPAAATPGTPAGPSMVPPTHRLSITTVVADQGNVAEPGVAVSAVLQPAAGGTVSKSARTVSLAAGGSVAVSLGGLRVAPGDAYTVTVSVTPPAGEAAGTPTSTTFPITVAPPSPPSVSAVTPTRGSRAGGTVVSIFGTGFTSASAVTFGHGTAHFSVVSSTQITATAPPGTGTVVVSVTNPGGTSATSTSTHFTYAGHSAPG